MTEIVDVTHRGFYDDLVYRWAPVHYQDIDDTHYRYDYLSKVNFDGDWQTIGNWDNVNSFALVPALYFSLVETRTHWFIIYGFYHPRDWCDYGFCDLFEQHENDFEGYLSIVQKPFGVQVNTHPYGFHLGMITVAHIDFYSYTNVLSSNQQNVDGRIYYTPLASGVLHPSSFQEAKGHGCYAWNRRQFPGGDGVRYYPGNSAREPGPPYYGPIGRVDVPYVLIDIFETGGLWERRCHPINQPFARSGSFAGRKGKNDAANPPWKWNDHDHRLGTGVMAYNPALLAWSYFSGFTRYSFRYLSRKYSPFACLSTEEMIAVEALPSLLTSSDPGETYLAALRLAAQNDPMSIDRLLQASLDADFSWEALTALSVQAENHDEFRTTLAERVADIFESLKSPVAEAYKGEIIGAIDEVDDLAPLVYLAGELRHPVFQDYLVTLYENRKHKRLQRLAAEALAKHEPSAIEGLKQIVVRELNSPDSEVRAASAELYGRWYSRDDVQPLRQLVFDDFPNVRKRAIYALSGVRNFESKGILEQLMSDSHWDVKVAATETLMRTFGMGSLEKVQEKLPAEYEYSVELLVKDTLALNAVFSDCPQTKDEYGQLSLITTIVEGLTHLKPELYPVPAISTGAVQMTEPGDKSGSGHIV